MSDQAPGQQDQSVSFDRKRPGRWGKLFLLSLQKNDPQQYQELNDSGELDQAIRSVQEVASAEYQSTLNALLAKETAPKRSKNRQAQVERLKRQAEEIVRASVVVPNPEWARQQEEGYTDQNTATWSEEPLLPKPGNPTPPTPSISRSAI